MSTAAVIGSTVAGVAGSVGSSLIGSSAAKSAANAQASAAEQAAALQHQDAQSALDFQKQVYGDQQRNIAPWLNTGSSAVQRLGFLMGLSPQQAQASNNAAGQQFNSGNPSQFNAPAGIINRPGVGTDGSGRPMLQDVNGAMLDPQNLPSGFNTNTIRANAYNGQMPTSSNQVMQQPQQNTTDVPSQNFGPAQFTGDPNDPSMTAGTLQNPDVGRFAPGSNGTISASGTGQVPRIDGGGAPGAADPNNPSDQFGYLAQTWNHPFNAPTDITEQNDPGYKFRLAQGQQALQNSAAAKGGLLSGGTAKSLSDYNQNAASGEYGNVYNRALGEYQQNYNIFKQNQNDLFNRFATLSGIGQTSAGQLNSAGSSAANNISNTLLTSGQQIGNNINNAGAARGSGYVGSANAITGGINNATNALSLLSLLNKGGGNTNVYNTGDPSICWIAEELYGKDDRRTHLVRSWLLNVYQFDPIGKYFVAAYNKYGETFAKFVKRFNVIRRIVKPIFDAFLSKAEAWQPAASIEDFESVWYQR